jgi:putative hemolysin
MLKESYSRYPLYEEEKDNIVGVLHLRDVTATYVSGEYKEKTLKEIARTPYFVPDTQSADTLFDEMQKKKIHMAIAVDEYGQMAGIVAMEDILEEIVGNIFDEYDIDERMILRQGANRYIMKGMTPMEEVEEALGIELEQDDFDTLNGWLISMLGHLPKDKEKAVISAGGCRFQIIDAKNNMIRNVKVVKEAMPDADTGG